MSPLLGLLAKTLLTLALGGLGGLVSFALGLPAPWLSGSMLAVGALAFTRAPLAFPALLRDVVFILLGISMGAGFNPETLEGVLHWPLSLLGLALSIPAIVAAAALYLVRFARWDPSTAFFASVPGALSFVMVLTLESRADPRLVALAQSMRLFVLVALLPSVIVASTPIVVVTGAPAGPAMLDGAAGALVLIGVSAAWGWLLDRLGMPAGLIMGSMLASAALHMAGVVGGQLPDVLLVPSFVALGCFIGLRFQGTSPDLLRRALAPSLMALLISVAVAAAFSYAVARALGLPLGQVLLAFAPGGLEAMTILAFALDLDPAYVGTHQLARYIGIALLLPFVARSFRLPRARAGGSD